MTDRNYIERSFDLALRGSGYVSPNPLVGAVIVKDGEVISEGWHEKYGGPHAEANAINNYTGDLSGSTLYCNLEPCCHTNKKTPPCAPLIISSGIKRVVISNLDPNPEVAGKGVSMMQESGIEVVSGILEEKGNELNRFFFKHIKTKQPYVSLKIAASLDGFISTGRDVQTWLTGSESKKYVHSLRASYDAVLVGASTVKVDNPKLNVRETEGRNPIKIVVDGNLSINPDVSLISEEPEKLIIYTSENSNPDKISKLRKMGVTVVPVSSNRDSTLELAKVVADIGSRGLSSLLVEGGANIFSQFVASDLFDDIHLLTAPVLLGSGLNFAPLKNRKELKIKRSQKIGEDQLLLLTK
ncbi:MAG: riboflavin biosynthesis protein RibD [Melioribacteraceae bacterium]|nr:MAG: riboflavin biosynthesis protein RibD [Melioribacteraceae bacterium]